jgi:UDP-2,3-diacylglucosamine hydrolase
MTENKCAYFISDAHLGIAFPGYERREQDLIQFLQRLHERADSLFILGDLFDFWIEYAHAIRPIYFNILHRFKSLIEAGMEIHYLAGNHDFALGPFLEKTIGMNLYFDHLSLTVQGKRLHLHHGDGLIRQEIGYRLLRFVLRNKVNQRLYRMLHPNVGITLAKLFSMTSRHLIKRRCSEKKRAKYRAVARGYLSRGDDIVIFAHTHFPEIIDYDGKIFCNAGEWIRRYTYARLENGQLSLWEYFPDKPHQRFEISASRK